MWALLGGAASLVGAVLTRNDNKKEAARVAAANRAEAERVAKANKAEAERVEKLRVKEANQAKQDNTQVREDYYKNVVADAQAAGINPLTALRTGGGSGYASAVAGTIRQPVMRDGVYLEGVYETPTLSRNPLASGLESAVNIGLAEFTRKQNYSHQSRMDELNKGLIKAQIASMTSELTRNPKLPRAEERHNYMLDSAGQFVLDADGYAIRREAFSNKAMQSDYRTTGADGKTFTVRSANTEHLDTSLNEAKGGAALIYGGGAIGATLTRQFGNNGGMPNIPRDPDIPNWNYGGKRSGGAARTRVIIRDFAN